MNKLAPKKLALDTELLVRLSPEHLETVVGGIADIQVNLRTCLFKSCQAK